MTETPLAPSLAPFSCNYSTDFPDILRGLGSRQTTVTSTGSRSRLPGGRSPLSRMGASIVRAAGLGDLVATSTAGYVALAVELATNAEHRAEAARRARLREGVALFDLDSWARGYENALASAWKCAVDGDLVDIHALRT